MAIELPPLPFPPGALAPHMSGTTLEFHYGKHHKGYVDTLNQLIENTPFAGRSLEEIILTSKDKEPKIFNNAAQAWNHTFFWNCLTGSAVAPSSDLQERIENDFDSMDEFRSQFNAQCKNLFGSGWTWLVKDAQGHLKIRALSNAGTPLTEGEVPLLACDVWEHAYYLDYQNERMKFVENFWRLVNWPFVEANLEKELEKPVRRQRHTPEERSETI